jgi:anhydro-N-acetylmuramic acid kinase
MSGTSLDGIAAAAVRFSPSRHGSLDRSFELLGHFVRPYESPERQRLERAIRNGATPAEWCQLTFDMGRWMADAANRLLTTSGIPWHRVRAIASHGQTVWHEPGRSTWQIGESAVIAEETGLDVISDFRVRDVAAGGQGAPLVPMADAVLFAAPRGWRALQNLGGIGNVTVVGPGGGEPARRPTADRSPRGIGGRPVRAFDTGPGVMVIDGVVRALRPELRYDVDGALAEQGAVVAGVVDALLTDRYFSASPPKSTGREYFGGAYVDQFIARCRAAAPRATDADIAATAVSLTARSVADAYRRFVTEPVSDVLLSGGGARNPTLVRALTQALAPRRVRLFADIFFDGEAKEAVAFALLGALHLEGAPGNVPSATGARGPRVLGKLTPSGMSSTASRRSSGSPVAKRSKA